MNHQEKISTNDINDWYGLEKQRNRKKDRGTNWQTDIQTDYLEGDPTIPTSFSDTWHKIVITKARA